MAGKISGTPQDGDIFLLDFNLNYKSLW